MIEVAFTLAVGLASAWLATRLKLPSGSILGPMLVVGGLQLTELFPTTRLGFEWRFVALALIGTVVGTTFTRAGVAFMVRTVRLASIGVLLLVLSGVLAALVLTRTTTVPLLTALLGLSPGGASEMAAMALDFHTDAGVVAALHMVRQISVFMSFPIIFKLLAPKKPAKGPLDRPAEP